MRRASWTLGFLLGLGSSGFMQGCNDGGGDGCPPGSESCPCLTNLCATGLTCVSGFCVNTGQGSGSGSGSSGQGDGDGDSGDGDGDGVGVNLCELLLDCTKQAQPELLSTYATLYGPEGECYDIPGLTQEDCWAECDALRKALALVHPEIAACGPPNCGDGKLDLDEMCDGIAGCTATCAYPTGGYEHDCSPLTQVGCDVGERCDLGVGQWDGSFYCADAGAGGSTPRSGGCWSSGECAGVNSLCVLRADCVNDGCCTDTCYLGATDEDFGACPVGYDCLPISDLYDFVSWPAGTNLVGLCL